MAFARALGDPALATRKMREDALEQMKELVDGAAGRALTAHERKLWEDLNKQVDYLGKKIQTLAMAGPVPGPWRITKATLSGISIDKDDLERLEREAAEPERERTFGVEPITAWRVWQIKDYEALDGRKELRLAPISDTLIWQPRQRITAVCTGSNPLWTGSPLIGAHEAPHPKCACGLWAVDRETAERMYRDGTRPSPSVFGTVAMWGRVLEFERGYRAQHAYPTSLYAYPEHEDAARDLGETYGVPVRILPGQIYRPVDPGELMVQIGINSQAAVQALQKAAAAARLGPMVMSAHTYRKLVGFPALSALSIDPPEKDERVEELAQHAIAGSHVIDVYVHRGSAEHAANEMLDYLRAHGDKYQCHGRFRIRFPSGGRYEAIAAKCEPELMRHFRGRRPDIVDLPPDLAPELRGYLTATGAKIL